MHRSAGARQCKKDFCIYAGNNVLIGIHYLLPECFHMLRLSSYILPFFQISDYNSAKADFGTELAISTRTELDPGIILHCHATHLRVPICICMPMHRVSGHIPHLLKHYFTYRYISPFLASY